MASYAPQVARATRAHPAIVVADPRAEALFAARAALKRALAMRRDAELQVKELRLLIKHLEAETRTSA